MEDEAPKLYYGKVAGLSRLTGISASMFYKYFHGLRGFSWPNAVLLEKITAIGKELWLDREIERIIVFVNRMNLKETNRNGQS